MDWKSVYLDTWEHPHRQMIVDLLKRTQFDSILELGCASGPNLLRIEKEFPGTRLSGVDINAQAIETARRFLPSDADLRVATLERAGFDDQSADVLLTDMVLIYVSDIHRVLAEIKRVVRKQVIFCELHSQRYVERIALKLATGYRAYDYPAVLHEHGFHDVQASKIPRHLWPGGRPQKHFGYVITACV